MIRSRLILLIITLVASSSFARPLRLLEPNCFQIKTLGKNEFVDIKIPKCNELLLTDEERAKLTAPTSDETEKIKAIEASLIEFGNDLNFDFSRRLNGLKSIKFLRECDPENPGVYTPEDGWIYALWSEALSFRYLVLLHEMIHSVQKSVIVIDGRNHEFIGAVLGLMTIAKDLEKFGELLHEGLTGLTETFISTHYWTRVASLKNIAGSRISYNRAEILIVDKIILDIAQAQQKNYLEIFNIFIEAMLIGDSSQVRSLIENRYGKDFVDRLMHQQADAEFRLAFELNIPKEDIESGYQNHKLGLDDALKHLSWPPAKESK